MIKTYERPQVMYSLDIGSANDDFFKSHASMMFLAKEVSKLVGGCTLIDSIGYWADVDRADRPDYQDVGIGMENNVQLQVKAELGKEHDLEIIIVKSFVAISEKWSELGINWVCGHKVTKEGLTVSFNFSVEENK